ncbi:MAG: DUF4249 domain-containing protein [Croceivirga sp.]
MKREAISLIVLCLSLTFLSCVEEVEINDSLQSEINIENVLIVEATITDEFINQEVLLSRGSSFANDSVLVYEPNASVTVVDDLGATFLFNYTSDGRYVSSEPFATQSGRSYQLFITTSEGEAYESEPVSSAGVSSIDTIYTERITSDNGVEGMAIFVDSSNPFGAFNNYRYTYAETYKIIAPNWTSSEFEIIREGIETIIDETTGEVEDILYPDVRLAPRLQEEQKCYNTVLSNSIILSDGLTLNESGIGRNQVRFINRNDPILSHRYSILVKQFLQSPDAVNFYNTLFQFSQNENLFSEIQPGLIEGNIKSIGNTENIALGYFEVASVAERRLFFNYSDFFPDEPLPPYFDNLNCSNVFSPPLPNPLRDGPSSLEECGAQRVLMEYLLAEEVEFFLSNSNPPPLCEGPYYVTLRACGDCTALGSNVVPDFWTEE